MARASLLLLLPFASSFVFGGCVEDTRPRGDGSITVDSSTMDGTTGDGATGDGASGDGGGGFNYCPGNEPTSVPACRVDSDCPTECGSCTVGSVCGGVGCATECSSDSDCAEGWCSTGCCSYCVSPCPDTPCPEGRRCDTTTGRCGIIPCDDPEAPPCGTNTRCTDGSCQRLACTTDTDCDCGTCASGYCYDRPGQCCPPLPG